MKFTVSQSSLTQAIGVVMKGVASASTLPILSGVLVKAQDGILEFQTSNYTISIRHRIAAHVEEEGEMVIPCKMLSNITKTLPDAPVTFELSERQVLIGCEKSSFRLNTLDANDFPEFPAYAIESAVELPTDILSEMVGRVWRVTSTDKARPILGGVHMKVENNTVRLVATDSFRLAVCDTQVETSTLEGSFELNVPADAFNDALNIMASQATIMIGATDTQVVFEAGNTTYVSRRIEGVYPNYKQLIPDSSGFPSSHIAHVRCVARSMATGTTLSIWTTRTPAPCTEFLGRTPMARSRACSIGPIAPATWPTPGTPAISTPPTAMYSPVAPPCSSSCRRSGGAGTRATPSA